MTLPRRLAQLLLRLGPWRAEAVIVGASVGGSLLLTLLSLQTLRDAGVGWRVPLTIATLVPLVVSTPVGFGLMALLRELDAARREAQRLASTDGLTGLDNRRHWIAQAEATLHGAAASSTPVTLLLLDVDHFKQVNDVHGHVAGDDILRAVAALCREVLQPGDSAARWGGEEFVLLLPGRTIDDGLRIAEALRAAVQDVAVDREGRTIRVTASVGVAWTGAADTGYDFDALLHGADCAMYTAKAAGRNGVRAADPAQQSWTGRFRVARLDP